jgi:hypothetical protein
MPFYRIIIHHNDGSTLSCIREHGSWDIEFVNKYFREQMKEGYKKKVQQIEVVQVSKQSNDVQEYLKDLKRPKGTFSK